MAVDVPALHGVPGGPVAYRHRIRRRGPLLALAVPAVLLLAAAFVSATVDCTGQACAVKGAVVLLLGLFAVPTAVLVGVPWEAGADRYLLALATSAALWMVLGGLAAFSATRQAVASWVDWWRELAVLAAGLFAGVLVGVAVMAIVLGGGLL